MIILQVWPNFLFVFKYCGIENIFVIRNEGRYLSTLQEQCAFDDITYEYFLEKLDKDSLSNLLLVVEGNKDFISAHFRNLEKHRARSLNDGRTKICLAFTERIRSFNFIGQAQWVKVVHHKDAGGATTTISHIAILPKEVWNRSTPETQKWFMTDFLKSTARGRKVEPGIAQHILFDSKNIDSLFRAPSVFVSTGWAERRLTTSEILRCLYVPQILDKILLAEIGEAANNNTWKYLLHAIPGNPYAFFKIL